MKTQTPTVADRRRADRIDQLLIAAVAAYGYALLARPIFPAATLNRPRIVATRTR